MTNLSMFQATRTETHSKPDSRTELDLAATLLGDTAHDLRTPLSSVRELSQMLVDGSDGPVSDSQRDRLTEVISRCEDMQRLIDDMLQFESAKSGTPKMHRCWIPPSQLPGDVTSLMQSKLHGRNIQLNWIGFERTLPLVYADQDKLKRFLGNLISNAIAATPDGSTIDLKTEIARSSDRIRISVQDHGSGMTEPQIQSVAQRGVSPMGGQGLGLAICRQIASLHFTRVGIESEIGQGTRFHIELPVGGPGAVIDAFVRWREQLLAVAGPNMDQGHRVRPTRRGNIATPDHMLPIDGAMPSYPHSVTMLSASAQNLRDESAALEFDRFLQGQCHIHELVYRVENDQWILLLDISMGQSDERIAQIVQSQKAYHSLSVNNNAIDWFGPVSLAVGSKQDRQRLQEAFVRGSLTINKTEPSVEDSEAPVMSEVAQKRLEAEVKWITQNFKRRQKSLKSQANEVRPAR